MTPRQMALVVIGILAIVALALLLGLRRGQPRRLRRAGGALPEPGGAPDASAIASGEPLQNRTPAVIESEPPAQQAARLDALRLLQGLAFGTPITAPPSSSAHDAIASTVRMSLASIVDKPNYAPRRPLLLPKLVQAMNDDQMSRRELSRIIAGDPALAGSLLRLANSPFYRLTREPIESLDRAVAVLGIEGMRSLIAAALLQPVFRVSGGSFAHFGDITWQHTLFAATGAEAHAAILENSDPFAAQLLSLMMGLSTIIVFRVTLDEFMSRQVAPQAAVMAQLINAQSAIVARHVAASWELSPRIDAALADQIESPLAPRSALGRSLQFGEFIGALAVLRARKVIDDAAAMAALHSGGEHAGAYERIWGRLTAAR